MVDALLSPALDTPLDSQSWLNSGGPLGGYCPTAGPEVVDIETIGLPASPAPDSHATQVDHSKWAVANTSGVAVWCALDNNRVESQFKRSGLAVCTPSGQGDSIGGVATLLRTAATAVRALSQTRPEMRAPPPHMSRERGTALTPLMGLAMRLAVGLVRRAVAAVAVALRRLLLLQRRFLQ
eukprot:6594195-Prymnesium_polylepis.2